MQVPSMEVYLNWVVDTLDQLPKDLIIKSFKGCRLTNSLDSSEDYKIFCFRPDGPIKNGKVLFWHVRSNPDFTGKREIIRQLDDDVEGVEKDSYNCGCHLIFISEF